MKLSNALTALAFSISMPFAACAHAAPVAAPAAQKPYDPTTPSAADAPVALPQGPALPAAVKADASLAGGGKSFLWEVKSKTNVVYLFGTIHVGKRAFYPLAAPVEAAFDRSERLVVEADISNNDGMADIDKIINYKAPDSLDKHIPAPLFGRLKTQLVRLQVPLDAVSP